MNLDIRVRGAEFNHFTAAVEFIDRTDFTAVFICLV